MPRGAEVGQATVVQATAGTGDHAAALGPLDLLPDVVVDLDLAGALPAGSPEEQGRTVVVSAGTLADLRRVLAVLDGLGSATRVVVVVLRHDRALSLGAPPDPRHAAVAVLSGPLERGGEAQRLSVRCAGPVPVSAVVRSVVAAAGPRGWRAATGLRVGLADPDLAAWVPGDPLARTLVDLPATTAVDVVLSRASTGTAPTVTVAREASWRELAVASGDALRDAVRLGPDGVPPVDEGAVNPVGFRAEGCAGTGELAPDPGRGWVVTEGGAPVVRLPRDGQVGPADLRALRRLDAVDVRWGGGHGPVAAARVVVQLAAAGVPLRSDAVPAWGAALLGPALTDLLERAPRWSASAPLTREEHSVRLRRAALTAHGCDARWRALAARAGVTVPAPRTVSVVLATRRPEMVGFAVDQVARQRGIDVQLVLALHGFGADDPRVTRALDGLDRPHVVVERPQDEVFGDVLNAAVARCDGDCVAKMDDDDWYGPHHLGDLLLAQRYSGAQAVGSAAEFVYLEQLGITVRRPFPSEQHTAYVAGGTLLVDRTALREVRGFRPVPHDVDGNLLRDLASAGGRVYRTHGLGFVLRRSSTGHTWSADATYFVRGKGPQWRGFRPSAELAVDPRHVPDRRLPEAS